MTGLDLVMVFSIILFARLGVRLVTRYIEMKGETKDENENEDEDEDEDEDKENER
jgi:hypothetical protein